MIIFIFLGVMGAIFAWTLGRFFECVGRVRIGGVWPRHDVDWR